MLPLPWADFDEMYEPIPHQSWADISALGKPRLEGRCLYIIVDGDMTSEYRYSGLPPEQLRRQYVMVLPRGWVQFDPDSLEIWVHGPDWREGPIGVGDDAQRVEISGPLGGLRSERCGGYPKVLSNYVSPCGRIPGRFDYPMCAVESYAFAQRIPQKEAHRRLAQLPVLEQAVEQILNLEQERVAGFGLEHSDPNQGELPNQGGRMTAWVALAGDDVPSTETQELVGAHDYLEVRTGAPESAAVLMTAQRQFADGRGVFLPRDVYEIPPQSIELADAVAWTWVDHEAGVLEIGIHDPLVPQRSLLSLNRWFDLIVEVLQPLIDVPFKVTEAQSYIAPDKFRK